MNQHQFDLYGEAGPHKPFRMLVWGDFAIIAPDGRDVTPRRRKSRALLAWLAFHRDHSISRERLASLLWGDRAEAQARASLRQTLYELGVFSAGTDPLLVVDHGSVKLCGHRLTEDMADDHASNDPTVPLLAGFDDLGEDYDEWLRYVRAKGRPSNAARQLDPRAIALYAEGRRLAGYTVTRPRCLACYEAAIAIQPDFGACWSALALERANAARWDARTVPFAVMADSAKAAIAEASRLNPGSGLHHVAHSLLLPHAHFRERERALERAILMDPDEPEVIRHFADFDYTVGRIRDAFRRILVANHIDPDNQTMTQNYALILYEMGHLQESEDIYRRAQLRWPNVRWPISDPLLNSSFCGDWGCVDKLMPQAIASRIPDMEVALWVVPALRNPTCADLERAQALAATNLRDNGYVDVSTLMFTYRIGLCDETFDWVERSNYSHVFAVDGRGPDTTPFRPGILFSVANRKLREDPRFIGLCAKIGLTRYWIESGNWPDCAETLRDTYDFIDLARRQPGQELTPLAQN